MLRSDEFLLCFSLSLLCFSVGAGAELSPDVEPTLAVQPTENLGPKKRAIEREIDRNLNAVKQLFELIDHTSDSDAEAREYFDQQIEQFDQRSEILHNELNKLEEIERWNEKKNGLRERAHRWSAQAIQLRKQGHLVPAALFDVKAQTILRSLSDGTWRLVVESEKRTSQPAPQLATVLKLNVEVASLSDETQQLRSQVQKLEMTVKEMEARIEKFMSGKPATDSAETTPVLMPTD